MDIKNRNLFRITRFILLKLPRLFKFFARYRAPRQRLLIIKTDAIGDYILFRNFIETVRLSDKYRNYRIDVLGNNLWRDIALKYDGAYADEFIFIKATELYEAPLKTLRLAWQLYRNNYDTVLQPTYTRTFINDGLAAFGVAKNIIGFQSDNESIAARYKIRTDRFYTRLLPLPPTVRFEFERTKLFFENVLNTSIPLNAPFINAPQGERKGIVIVPGAGVVKRCWEAEKFLELIKLILKHTNQTVYLEGGPSRLNFTEYLQDDIAEHRVVDLTGKTTLLQLIDLIGSAALVIANETSAIHIAAAAKTTSVCIVGGGHFERFTPYPAYMETRPVCVYEKLPCYYCDWNCIYKTAETDPYPCVGTVEVSSVWLQVLPLLPQ